MRRGTAETRHRGCRRLGGPGPRRIKQVVAAVAVGRPLAFTYQVGQYLPDWHPWESYKDFYVSKRATGAYREIVPFELAWLIDVLAR